MATVPSTQKILTSSEAVNTTYGGSQALKELNTWYTMEDISNTVKPYKVFTALLTQSGDEQAFDISEGSLLTIGVTYTIIKLEGGIPGDFTNVGAPNNDMGTSFIATGTTPNSWGNDLLQYIAGAPFANVLENTIGNIWFRYNQEGFYIASSNQLFTVGKTFAWSTSRSEEDGTGFRVVTTALNNINELNIYSTNPIAELALNDSLYYTPIEIRVYN